MRRPCLYYITDRSAFPGPEADRRRRLLDKIAEAARAGIDFIQLREKDLSTHDLESLAKEALRSIREAQPSRSEHQELRTGNWEPGTKLLVNSRTDVALATGAGGVHLRSHDISVSDARAIWSASASHAPNPIIAVSCHTSEEIAETSAMQASFAVFAPVFEKIATPSAKPAGLDSLRDACRFSIPVLALGGVTLENAKDCLNAGASGIAAIRLFQENNIADVVLRLRSI